MKYSIVYSSQTGNTKQLADCLQRTLPFSDCLYFGTPAPQAAEAKRLYIGFWTDKGTCDPQTAAFLKTLTDQEVFLFGTAGFGVSQAYFDQVLDRAAAMLPSSVTVIGRYMCMGRMPMSVRDRYVKLRETDGMQEKMDGMIKNFDRALSHPDEADLSALAAAVSGI